MLHFKILLLVLYVVITHVNVTHNVINVLFLLLLMFLNVHNTIIICCFYKSPIHYMKLNDNFLAPSCLPFFPLRRRIHCSSAFIVINPFYALLPINCRKKKD